MTLPNKNPKLILPLIEGEAYLLGDGRITKLKKPLASHVSYPPEGFRFSPDGELLNPPTIVEGPVADVEVYGWGKWIFETWADPEVREDAIRRRVNSPPASLAKEEFKLLLKMLSDPIYSTSALVLPLIPGESYLTRDGRVLKDLQNIPTLSRQYAQGYRTKIKGKKFTFLHNAEGQINTDVPNEANPNDLVAGPLSAIELDASLMNWVGTRWNAAHFAEALENRLQEVDTDSVEVRQELRLLVGIWLDAGELK